MNKVVLSLMVWFVDEKIQQKTLFNWWKGYNKDLDKILSLSEKATERLNGTHEQVWYDKHLSLQLITKMYCTDYAGNLPSSFAVVNCDFFSEQ